MTLTHSDSGHRISPPLSLGAANKAASSLITWDATVPENTMLTVSVGVNASAVTPPASWTPAVSGQAIPGITAGMHLHGLYLWVRVDLATAAFGEAPELSSVEVEITGTPYTTSETHVQGFLRGIVGGWGLYDENVIRVTITNELILWNKKPLRMQSSSCPWVFKGADCGYSGSAVSCDQTYERCRTLGNTDQYGGDRYLNAMMEKEIFWGRTQKL